MGAQKIKRAQARGHFPRSGIESNLATQVFLIMQKKIIYLARLSAWQAIHIMKKNTVADTFLSNT